MTDRVLILTETDPAYDPRVRRQIEALEDDYDVCVAGRLADPAASPVSSVQISQGEPLTARRRARRAIEFALRRYDRYYWHPVREDCLRRLRTMVPEFRLILANEPGTLPLALTLSDSGARVLFDAHEFYPAEWEESILWRLRMARYVDWICRTSVPRADCCTTVSAGVAEAYRKYYGTTCVVIRNACQYHDFEPTPVGPDRIRLVHHGSATAGRQLERMIEAISLVPSAKGRRR
jgi:Glycosyl transferase 4-like domain